MSSRSVAGQVVVVAIAGCLLVHDTLASSPAPTGPADRPPGLAASGPGGSGAGGAAARPRPLWLPPARPSPPASAAVSTPVSTSTTGPWRSEDARVAFEKGRDHQEDGVLVYAVDQYQMALAKEDRPQIHLKLGECFDALKQPVLAASHFETYVRAVPADAEAWNRLGCIQIKLKRFDDAVVSFKQLAALAPELGQGGLRTAFLAMGAQLLEQKQPLKAYRAFVQALEAGGTEPRAVDGVHRSLQAALAELGGRARAADRLQVLLLMYEHGELVGLRSRLERTFAEAGRPQALRQRVTKILSDPALK
ncbi:MAG: tetratricopeptide repeat protein [Candidatus Riflebacteria bacterium]|nr:tetratricopeptide repeat protein [Candidatus Riflebacteria bacterium]